MRIRVTLKDNYVNYFEKTVEITVTEHVYTVLENFDMDEYDEIWDDLVEKIIPRQVGGLTPDWYVDHIEYL